MNQLCQAFHQWGLMMDGLYKQGIVKAMDRIPSGLFVVTARDENHRAGILASWVQQASDCPPMVMVAIEKGSCVLPLISSSRHFGLCQVPRSKQLLVERFSDNHLIYKDPFVGCRILNRTKTHVPILAGMQSYLECEVASHFDVDGDHDLFIGRVCAGGYNGGRTSAGNRKLMTAIH